MNKYITILAAALLLCSCNCRQAAAPGPITTGDDCIVQISAGKILGYNDAGIYTFKGVPYAKAERFTVGKVSARPKSTVPRPCRART